MKVFDNNLSIRYLPNTVQLFDCTPIRIEFNCRWVMVESKISFPFHPLVGEKEKWNNATRNVLLMPAEVRFMFALSYYLGSDPRRQTRVYSMVDLLSEKSLVGRGIERRRQELGTG